MSTIIFPRAPVSFLLVLYKFMIQKKQEIVKRITNYKNGHHLNSSYWQNYKKTLPALPQPCFEIAFGMLLGDASIYKVSNHALIKFEQGYKQQAFLEHLFDKFKNYCFMDQPGKRFLLDNSKKTNQIKSFWFKTFSHKTFTQLYFIFYENKTNLGFYKKKTITPGLITNYLTPKGLAYLIMCDGSLQNDKKSIILHTQGFSEKENLILSNELNMKFNLKTKVILHKKIYYVLKTSSTDALQIVDLIQNYMITSMEYKLPEPKQS